MIMGLEEILRLLDTCWCMGSVLVEAAVTGDCRTLSLDFLLAAGAPEMSSTLLDALATSLCRLLWDRLTVTT